MVRKVRKTARKRRGAAPRRIKGGGPIRNKLDLQQQHKQQNNARQSGGPRTVRELVELTDILRYDDMKESAERLWEDHQWILDNSELVLSLVEDSEAAGHALAAESTAADAWDQLAELLPDAPICTEFSDDVAQMLETARFWIVPLTTAPAPLMHRIMWYPNEKMFRDLARAHYLVGPQPAPPHLEDVRRLEAKRLLLMLDASRKHMNATRITNLKQLSDVQRWRHVLVVLAHDPEPCNSVAATGEDTKQVGGALQLVEANAYLYLGGRRITEEVVEGVCNDADVHILERCPTVLRWFVRSALQLVEDISSPDHDQFGVMYELAGLLYHRREYNTTLTVTLQEIALAMGTQKKALDESFVRFVIIHGTQPIAIDDPLGEDTIDLLARVLGETRAATKEWLNIEDGDGTEDEDED
jgi:hypothetical protein